MLIMNMAFMASYYLRFGSLTEWQNNSNTALAIFVNLSWIVLAALTKPYKFERISRVAKILRSLFAFVILHLLSVTAFFVFQNTYFFSREQLITSYSVLMITIIVWRIGFVYLLRIFRKKGFNHRNVIVVGFGELSWELQRFFRLHPEHGFKFLGFFDNKEKSPRVKGNFNDIFTYCEENHIDEIYCCLPYVRYSQIKRLIDFGEEHLIKVKLIADFRGFPFKGLELQRYDHIPVLNVTSTPLDEKKNQIIKRAFDIAFSGAVILLIFSWFMPLMALIIKVDSRGPVFYKQKRAGKDNKPFTCWKFRSMRVTEETSEFKQAMKNDPRITKLGAFIRKTSIDELPQFFNVFIGHMSLIGPRPHPIKLNEEFSPKIDKFMARHFVKPGITGLAQAKGYRGETQTVDVMKNRVKLDRFYIENWSLFLDIKIILLTISTLIKGDENAY
ncbi:MAG: undecaprenyl-phosphate glucose phosphotransferase [Bacteroidota bacterium]